MLDRAHVLLSVGVADEALELTRRAVDRYADDPAGMAEALLAWAEAAFAAGDAASAKAFRAC